MPIGNQAAGRDEQVRYRADFARGFALAGLKEGNRYRGTHSTHFITPTRHIAPCVATPGCHSTSRLVAYRQPARPHTKTDHPDRIHPPHSVCSRPMVRVGSCDGDKAAASTKHFKIDGANVDFEKPKNSPSMAVQVNKFSRRKMHRPVGVRSCGNYRGNSRADTSVVDR